jgi:hypothetical protein
MEAWVDTFGQSTMRTKVMSNATLNFARPERAVSSVGERFLDTEEVTCSIHVPPTTFSLIPQRFSTPYKGSFVFGWANGRAGVREIPWNSCLNAQETEPGSAWQRQLVPRSLSGSDSTDFLTLHKVHTVCGRHRDGVA